jgi:hypothetical protein
MDPRRLPVLNEWRDLKTVAGTGQAVGFGRWLYSGPFENLKPGAPPENLPHIFSGANMTDMRVRPAGMTPGTPALYQTKFRSCEVDGFRLPRGHRPTPAGSVEVERGSA